MICSDPPENNDWALIEACKNGTVEEVAQLLDICERETNSYALQVAVGNSCLEIIQFLIPFSDYHQTLNRIKFNNTLNIGYTDTRVFEQCIGEYENEQQCKRLEKVVEQRLHLIGVRKM